MENESIESEFSSDSISLFNEDDYEPLPTGDFVTWDPENNLLSSTSLNTNDTETFGKIPTGRDLLLKKLINWFVSGKFLRRKL